MPERVHLIGAVDDPQDGSPGLDELEQREALPEIPIPAVPVHVDGPVTTQELPGRTSALRTVVCDSGQGVELLPKDLRRKRALILAVDEPVTVALTTNGAATAGAGSRADGAYVPKLIWLTLNGSSAVYVAPVAAAITGAKVSVITESWAD